MSSDERPGLLHFVPLRPYNDMQNMQINHNGYMIMVGAQWNEVQ